MGLISDDDRRDVRQGSLFGMKWATVWVFFVVLLVAVIGIGGWAFGVFTSDIKGQGDAKKSKNSGTNRVFAQQRFEELKAAIDKDVANIRVAKVTVRLNASPVNQTNVAGVMQICNADVAEYNAEARKFLSREFRAADLPPSIDLAVCE